MKKEVWNSPKYRRNALPQNQWETRFFHQETDLSGATVLQVGVGDGLITKRLSESVRDGLVVGVEYDPSLFAKAIKGGALGIENNVTFRKADPCALPSNLPHAPFDILVSHSSIERGQNYTRLLSRFVRLIRDGGFVYFEMAGEGDCESLYKIIEQVRNEPEFKTSFSGFRFPYILLTEERLNELMVSTAFHQISVSRRSEKTIIDKGRFKGWLREHTAQPYFDFLPPTIGERFIERVAGKYGKTGGKYEITRSVLAGKGSKMWGELQGDLYPSAPVSLD